MGNLWIKEVWTNEDQEVRVGDSGPYETFTDDVGELFQSLQKEYGKCVSKLYMEPEIQIGWVFEKRQKYTDCDETYLQSTWVSVYDKEPETTVKHFYHNFDGKENHGLHNRE